MIEPMAGFYIKNILNILVAIFFVAFGGFENVAIIRMLHKKSNLLGGQKFLLFLAYFDLCGCVFGAPMIAATIYWNELSSDKWTTFYIVYEIPMAFISIIYQYATVVMAFDRVQAITRPFSYKPLKTTTFLWIVTLSIPYEIIVILAFFGLIPNLISTTFSLVVTLGILMTLAVCYVIIYVKLREQGRKVGEMTSRSVQAAEAGQQTTNAGVTSQNEHVSS